MRLDREAHGRSYLKRGAAFVTDVFVCYASEDRAVCDRIVAELRPQWDFWIDDNSVGRFSEQIQRAIRDCKCILAIWSQASRSKDDVGAELDLAKKLKLPIIPVRIDDSDPPWGFQSFTRIDLIGWAGDPLDSRLRLLKHKLNRIVPPKSAPARPVSIGTLAVRLPAIFLSVSSFETQLLPVEALRALRVGRFPSALVSAYDLVPGRSGRAMFAELERYRATGGFVLVDSGNYESTRLKDKTWTTKRLSLVLKNLFKNDWALCFDVLHPKEKLAEAVKQITRAVERDANRCECPVLPIVHARQRKEGGFHTHELPELIARLAERLHPEMIAIPERELGPGIIARAKTVRAIRNALNHLPYYQPLHLLGTGNPWTIAILAAAGADSFDGLEWCRMVVNAPNHMLNHFQHFDLYRYQMQYSADDVARAAFDDPGIDFAGRAAIHNLSYYRTLLGEIQRSALKDNFEALFQGMFGQQTTHDIRKAMPELLP